MLPLLDEVDVRGQADRLDLRPLSTGLPNAEGAAVEPELNGGFGVRLLLHRLFVTKGR